MQIFCYLFIYLFILFLGWWVCSGGFVASLFQNLDDGGNIIDRTKSKKFLAQRDVCGFYFEGEPGVI